MRKVSVLALAAILSSLAWAADVNSDFGLEESFVPSQPAVVGSPKALTWADRTAINPGASRLTAAAVNGKVYRIGGEASTGRLGWTQEYDPITNAWTDRDSMPVPGSNLCCAVWNNKIYVPGGYNGTAYIANLQVFDPATGTWTEETAMPGLLAGSGCAVVGDTLYVMGGYNGTVYVNTVYAYNLVAQTWSSKAPMAYARGFLGAATVGGKIYAVGGRDGTTVDMNYIEEYDPATNSWSTKAAMPTARGGVGVTSFGGKVYAVGGGWMSYLNTIDVYDPVANSWSTETAMLHGCRTIGVAAMGNDIFVVGGWAGSYLAYNQLGGQAPQVIWTSPSNGATGAHVGSPAVKVAFSEPMNTWGYSWTPNPGSVNGTWNATRDTLTITHNQLAYSTTNTIGVGGQDLSGQWTVAGPVPNPFTFTTWDAPDVIQDQSSGTVISAQVSQIFGDSPTRTSYGADDINISGMDSVVVTAVEVTGWGWSGHTFHPLDSMYLSFTTDSTDYPAWSQEIWSGNFNPGTFDDVPAGGSLNKVIIYLDQPVVLDNGKNWMMCATHMNLAAMAKDGYWGWASDDQSSPSGSAPAWRNPGGYFGGNTNWQRASVSGNFVFRALGKTYPATHAFGTVDTSITVAGPGDYTLAGITFCSADSNFYFVSMNDDIVYRLDPDDWSCAPAFAVDNAAGEIPWGISWDGSHFWVGQIANSMTYVYDKQYTFAGAYTGTYYNATGIGGSSWMGAMDHDGTHTWQLAVGGSNKLYKLDLPGGTLVDSIPSVFWGATSQRACCWIPWTSQFISGGWNSGQIYLVDTLGQEVAGSPALGSVADVDIYDFINVGQELWGLVTINTSPNTIHKVWLGITRPTGVEGSPLSPLAGSSLSLMPNFPNPVRGRTNISFNLPKAGAYELRVFNIAGQMVDRISGTGQAGPNRLTWNAGRLAAGVYLYSVSSNGQSATRKLVVVK